MRRYVLPIAVLLVMLLLPAAPAYAASVGDVELIMNCVTPKHTMRYTSNGVWTPYGNPDPTRQLGSSQPRDVGIAVVGGDSHSVVVTSGGQLYHAIRFPDGAWSLFLPVDGRLVSRVAVTDVNGDLWVVASNEYGAWITIRSGATGWWTGLRQFWTPAPGETITNLSVAWVVGLDVFPFITTNRGRLVTGALRGTTLVNSWVMRSDVSTAAVDSTNAGSLHLAAILTNGQVVHQALPRLGQWTGWTDLDVATGYTLPGNRDDIAIASDGYGAVSVAVTVRTVIGPDIYWMPWHAMRFTSGYWSSFNDLRPHAGNSCVLPVDIAMAGH